jgi:CheY-like chemotaxis protein
VYQFNGSQKLRLHRALQRLWQERTSPRSGIFERIPASGGMVFPSFFRAPVLNGLMLVTPMIRILVIDDNDAHGDGLMELLALAGFDSYHVTTGQSGIDFIQEIPVDAVLLDVHLPDMTGYEVCSRIRQDPKTSSVAIIFHTGESRQVRPDCGEDAFLTYPVDFRDLTTVITACVLRRKFKQANAASLTNERS